MAEDTDNASEGPAEADNPFGGAPMSLHEALAKADNLLDEARETTQEEPSEEAETQAEEVTSVDVTEETAESSSEVEDQTQDEGPQVLTRDEYGDILIQAADEEISLSELLDGYQRRADYSRKTASVSEERKALEEERAALANERQELLKKFAGEEEKEPDWVALAEEDPLGWAAERAKWDAKKAERDAAKVEVQAAEEEQRNAFAAQTAESAVGIVPEWSNPENYKAGMPGRRDTALKFGFTERELAANVDLRLVALVEWAKRGLEAADDGATKKAALEKKLSKTPKVLKPGASRGDSNPEDERRAARQKLLTRKGGVSLSEIVGR